MKRIFFAIGLILITLPSFATVRDTIPYNKGLSSYGYAIHRIIVDSVLVPPRIDTTSGTDTVRVGSLVFRTVGGDHTLYIRYPDKWERIGTASVQTLSKNTYGDSIYLSGGGGVVFDRDTQQLNIITGAISGDTLKLTRSVPVFLPYLARNAFIDSLNDNRQVLGYDSIHNKLWLIPGDTVHLKTGSVFSVNGKTGVVILTTDSISEGSTNLYFTQTRARAAVSGSSSISYNSSTGIFSAKISSDSGNTLVVNADGLYVPGGDYANKDSVYTKSQSDGRYLRTIGGIVTGPINYSSTPVASSELVNKAYVDALASGLSWKDAVIAASTGNLDLSGLVAVDGVSVSAGERVLAKNQTDSTENGIYVVASGAWTRATDAAQGNQIKGMAVYVDAGGVTNGGTQWVNANTSTITVGTTGIYFTQFGATSVTVPPISQVLAAGDSTSHRIKVGDATATSVTVPDLANSSFLSTDGNGKLEAGTSLPQTNVEHLGDSLQSKVNVKDSGKVYMTPYDVHANTSDSLSNYVNVSHAQTITGAKTFSSTTQFLSGSGSTVRLIRTLASGGTRNTLAAELDFEPTTPQVGIGSSIRFRAFDTTKNLVSVGSIGASLMNIATGAQYGEIHISPAWHGSAIDSNSAGLEVIATGPDSADTHIKRGSLYLESAPESGTSSDSMLLRGSRGQIKQMPISSLPVIHTIDTVGTITSLKAYSGDAHIIIVTDTLQGGTFYKSSKSLTNDNGVVFSASGGEHWVRVYDQSRGVNVDWWGSRDEVAINRAINYVGEGGIINFTANKIYTLSGSILPKNNQTLIGNNATLLRSDDSVVHLTSNAIVGNNFFVVNAIPSSWLNGGLVQLFTDSTDFGCVNSGQFIATIRGDTVTLGSGIPPNVSNWNHPTRTYWPKDTTNVRQVFDMVEASQGINYRLVGLNFNGNKYQNNGNYSWTVNASVDMRGNGAQSIVDDCHFYNTPNENIVGQGFRILHNTADSLNGSFVHMSATYNVVPIPVPSIISGNYVNNSNIIPDTIGGHSEGSITCSLTPGYVNIENNRFNGGSDAFIGIIANSAGATNGSFRNVIITGNYAKGFHRIFNSLAPTVTSYPHAGHILVTGNIFDDCDTTDWTSQQNSIDEYFDTITVGENQLVGGTVWDIPIQKSDASQRYIINNNTGTAQGADININGNIRGDSIISTAIESTPVVGADAGGHFQSADSTKDYVTPTHLKQYVEDNIPGFQAVTTAGDSTSVARVTFNSADAPVTIGSDMGLMINLNHRPGGWVKGLQISQPSPSNDLNRGVVFGVKGNDSLVNYSYWLATNDSISNDYSSNNGVRLYPDGSLWYGIPPANSSASTEFLGLSSDGHTISTRTASQVLSDIGAASSTNVALLSSDNTFTGANSFAEVPRITSSTPGHNAIYFSDASGGTGSSPTYNVIGFNGTSFYFTPVNKTNAAQFSATELTARRTYTLPDNSGNLWTSGGDDSTSGNIHVAGAGWFGGITGFGGTPSSPYATINGLGQVSAQTLSTVSDATIGGNVTTTEYRVSDLNTAPSSATDTGTKGEIRITSGYIYVCIATNTWVRAALSTW